MMYNKGGYPTDEYLELVKTTKPLEKALELVADAWKWQDRANQVRPGVWTFSTGGWSGNEDLLEALRENICMMANWKFISLPGGLFCVATTKEAQVEMDKLHDHMRDWAWDEGVQG